MREEIFPKSNFKMKITYMKKIKENDKEAYKVIETKWIKGNGKQLRDSIFEDRKNKINRTIEIVNEKPTSFKFNQLYMLPTRDIMWIYVERSDDDE